MNFKYLFYSFLVLSGFCVGCDSDDDVIDNPDGTIDVITQQKSFKRGVSYNFQLPEEDMELLGSAISWFYNWGVGVGTQLDEIMSEKGIDFYPMAWNGLSANSKNNIRSFKAAHPACEYILAFNEPNLTDQANMTPAEAADLWPDLKVFADELGMKIISPAMNYGTYEGYHDPIKWLDEFFELIPLSDVEGIAIHCYMGTPAAVVSYINMFKKYGKPIWMTEFCGYEDGLINSPADQMAYMCDVINYMECDPDVYRYAWFIPRWNIATNAFPYMQLLTKTKPYELTDLGKVFVNFSTFDQSAYCNKGQLVPAAHYTLLNLIDAVETGTLGRSIRIRLSTDKEYEVPVEVYNFLTNCWVEYQINVPEDGEYFFNLRYASYVGAKINLSVHGKIIRELDLEKTGEDNIWETYQTSLSLSKGKQTLRFTMASGSACLTWFSFE